MATNNELNLGLSGSTGSGSFVGSTSPTFVTPNIGAATVTSINKVAFTAPASAATLTIANNKSLTSSNTLTFNGTDSSTITFGAGGTAAYNSGFTAWTPTLTFATPGDLSVVYVTQIGSYVKIGSQVAITFSLQGTPTYTTASGAFNIGGLPFASRSTTNNTAVGSLYISTTDTWTASRPSIILQIIANSSVIRVQSSGTGVAFSLWGTGQIVSGTSINIVGSITYLT